MKTKDFWHLMSYNLNNNVGKFADNINYFSRDISKGNWHIIDHMNIKEPIYDGIYLTIRWTPEGLKTVINEYVKGVWQISLPDNGKTIMYRDFTENEIEYLKNEH